MFQPKINTTNATDIASAVRNRRNVTAMLTVKLAVNVDAFAAAELNQTCLHVRDMDTSYSTACANIAGLMTADNDAVWLYQAELAKDANAPDISPINACKQFCTAEVRGGKRDIAQATADGWLAAIRDGDIEPLHALPTYDGDTAYRVLCDMAKALRECAFGSALPQDAITSFNADMLDALANASDMEF